MIFRVLFVCLVSLASVLANDATTDVVFLDTETTGFSHENDRIIEIACIKIKGTNEISSLSILINPGIPIPKAATDVNKITDEMVKDAKTFAMAYPDISSFLSNSVVVAYNCPFDYAFLQAEAKRNGLKAIDSQFIDAMRLCKSVLKGCTSYSLGSVAAHLNISAEAKHRALADVRTLKEVYFLCIPKLPPESKIDSFRYPTPKNTVKDK